MYYPQPVDDAKPTEDRLRASDADRQRLIATLETHATAGRLSLDEYTERVDKAVQARTYGELAALVRDLPAASAVDHATSGRQLLIAFLLALLALTIIGVAVTVFR